MYIRMYTYIYIYIYIYICTLIYVCVYYMNFMSMTIRKSLRSAKRRVAALLTWLTAVDVSAKGFVKGLANGFAKGIADLFSNGFAIFIS